MLRIVPPLKQHGTPKKARKKLLPFPATLREIERGLHKL